MAGFEPAVIGKAVSLAQNQVSAPVKGNAGVYVLAATSVTKTPGEFNAAAEKQAMRSRFSFSTPNAILMDMRDKAEITDNRLNFY
jgi:peptidyl-prolyl cis-trans isomerase D